LASLITPAKTALLMVFARTVLYQTSLRELDPDEAYLSLRQWVTRLKKIPYTVPYLYRPARIGNKTACKQWFIQMVPFDVKHV
jgi:hypothetical protein